MLESVHYHNGFSYTNNTAIFTFSINNCSLTFKILIWKPNNVISSAQAMSYAQFVPCSS